MCGICGELRFDGPTGLERISLMRDALAHRGPDSAGIFLSPDARVGLGFRRLRIIDLTPEADQPMPNEDGSIQLVFNGEIYNFQVLRRELEQKGHRFRSRSDSEAIVHLYEEEGESAIRRLDGMFALAIWDGRRKRLVLARDRAGKKPLFYARTPHAFLFASEIKSFFGLDDVPIEVDPEVVPQYFVHGYAPSPRTMYRNVRQVEPASTLTIDADGRVTSSVYWRLRMHSVPPTGSHSDEREAASQIRRLLTAAVERRLVSDVPLGAFLSGGLDSTIVVGLMSRLTGSRVRTFSIGFEGDPRYDETRYAREVANRFGTDHTEFVVRPSAVDLLDVLIRHYDGPFGDASAIPTYIVSKLTRQHVTVVLTGDGGDEVFAGYHRFAAAVAAERIPASLRGSLRLLLNALPATADGRHWFARARRFAQAMGLPLYERLTRWNSLFYDDLEQLLAPDLVASLSPIDRLRYLEGERESMKGLSTLGALLHANFRSYLLDDLLVKTDRCTMANSLEARSPFLDTDLVEYAAGLPDAFKLSGLTTKVILRRACRDLLPRSVATRGKMGFGVPLDTWFRTELRDPLRDLLLDSSARYRTYLSSPYVHRLVTRHLAGEVNGGLPLWSILTFERWLRQLPAWTRRVAAA